MNMGNRGSCDVSFSPAPFYHSPGPGACAHWIDKSGTEFHWREIVFGSASLVAILCRLPQPAAGQADHCRTGKGESNGCRSKIYPSVIQDLVPPFRVAEVEAELFNSIW